jgi:hypothetical protein
MAIRKRKASKAQARNLASMDAQTAVRNWIEESPDVRLVQEIAMRARDVEAREPPCEMDMTTETIATPIKSQGLWKNPV